MNRRISHEELYKRVESFLSTKEGQALLERLINKQKSRNTQNIEAKLQKLVNITKNVGRE